MQNVEFIYLLFYIFELNELDFSDHLKVEDIFVVSSF